MDKYIVIFLAAFICHFCTGCTLTIKVAPLDDNDPVQQVIEQHEELNGHD